MEQLSIEEKAQRYDKAIERANSLLSGNQLGNAWIYKLLPELKESEDEKIRKALVDTFKFYDLSMDSPYLLGIDKKDVLTWLEAQGEQNLVWGDGDEKYSSYICAALQCYYRLREDRNNTNGQEDLDKARNWLYNRLKSLRPQNNITDEELAQAKKDAYNDVLDKIEYNSENPTFDDVFRAAINYIRKKAIRSQNTWKPSDEQVDAVKDAMDYLGCNTKKVREYLMSLYEQLKKLREE